jgi:hypothetical protein
MVDAAYKPRRDLPIGQNDPLGEGTIYPFRAGCESWVGPNDIVHELDSNHRQECIRNRVECFHALDYLCIRRFEYRSR